MELQKLSHEVVCSICGCRDITEERKEHKHTCGEWNEYRKFRCGRKIHYSPNFRRVIVQTECPRHPDIILKREKRNVARIRLRTYIDKLSVDQEFKDQLLQELQHDFKYK